MACSPSSGESFNFVYTPLGMEADWIKGNRHTFPNTGVLFLMDSPRSSGLCPSNAVFTALHALKTVFRRLRGVSVVNQIVLRVPTRAGSAGAALTVPRACFAGEDLTTLCQFGVSIQSSRVDALTLRARALPLSPAWCRKLGIEFKVFRAARGNVWPARALVPTHKRAPVNVSCDRPRGSITMWNFFVDARFSHLCYNWVGGPLTPWRGGPIFDCQLLKRLGFGSIRCGSALPKSLRIWPAAFRGRV